MNFVGDIDIDVADRSILLSHIKHVNAMVRNTSGVETIHPVGIYVQDIPSNPLTGRATFEYTVAAELGYQKIDILNNSIYEDVIDNEHLERLMDVSIVRWDLLENEEVVNQLPHIKGHFDVVSSISPRTIDDLALILALIRPAKRHLVGENINIIRDMIWLPPENGAYYFKKSHSYAFAMTLIVKLNLMAEYGLF